MAAKKAKAPASANGTEKRKPPWLRITIILIALAFAGVSLPTVILMFFGMLPTWVAFTVDRGVHRYLTFSVGGLNFCGIFPFLMELWSGSNSISLAISLLTDVFALVVMLGAAAFGWMLHRTIPPVIATFLKIASEQRVANLRETQQKLINEWGDDVTGQEKQAHH